MKSTTFIACDLGASSGRVIAGTLDNGILSLNERHRFPTNTVETPGGVHWDLDGLYNHILDGLEKCKGLPDPPLSIAIDSWGVDYGLFDDNGTLLEQPHCYRDPRNLPAFHSLTRRLCVQSIYDHTGIQLLPINTLYQLEAQQSADPDLLKRAVKLLFIPSIIGYFLTGIQKNEFTFATTSQLFNPQIHAWSPLLLNAVKIEKTLLGEIINPGSVLGNLRETVSKRTGLASIPVVVIGSHDTASAIAATPLRDRGCAYLSSGTWSLLGIETDKPIITDISRKYGFTNEGGICNTYRVLKNITGMWLLTECKRAWASAVEYTFDDIVALYLQSQPFKSLIDPDWHGFVRPADMPSAINLFCNKTGQPIPESHAEYVRTIFDSLALKYRYTLDQLQEISPVPITQIQIVGGGSQNQVLCQAVAHATNLPVEAGPVEATAMGNILTQAMAQGYIHDITELRMIVRNSVRTIRYYPDESSLWQQQMSRFVQLIAFSIQTTQDAL